MGKVLRSHIAHAILGIGDVVHIDCSFICVWRLG